MQLDGGFSTQSNWTIKLGVPEMLRLSFLFLAAVMLTGVIFAAGQPALAGSLYAQYYPSPSSPPPCEAETQGRLRGAGRGAAGGALIGAISGNAGRGAAIGAGFGALRGAVRRGSARSAGACY